MVDTKAGAAMSRSRRRRRGSGSGMGLNRRCSGGRFLSLAVDTRVGGPLTSGGRGGGVGLRTGEGAALVTASGCCCSNGSGRRWASSAFSSSWVGGSAMANMLSINSTGSSCWGSMGAWASVARAQSEGGRGRGWAIPVPMSICTPKGRRRSTPNITPTLSKP